MVYNVQLIVYRSTWNIVNSSFFLSRNTDVGFGAQLFLQCYTGYRLIRQLFVPSIYLSSGIQEVQMSDWLEVDHRLWDD